MWKWNLICRLVVLISRSNERLLRRLRRLRERVSREIARFEDFWEVTIGRPKRVEGRVASVVPQTAAVAVVIQGPILEEDDFTLQTVKLFRTTFPASPLIVSTSDDTPPHLLEALQSAGARTITSRAPEVPGPWNLNRQIHSTRAGLEAARRLGATFALKTRSDVRLYAAHVGDYLAGLWKAFPLDVEGRQRGRLVVLDLATRLLVPHHPSDMLMFGHVDDLLDYWSLPMRGSDEELSRTRIFGDFLDYPIPEVLLCEHYLELVGERPKRTLADWWRVLGQRFMVMDRSSLQFFWKKYNYAENHQMSLDDENRNLRLCSFCDWVNLAMWDKKPPFETEALAPFPKNDLIRAA